MEILIIALASLFALASVSSLDSEEKLRDYQFKQRCREMYLDKEDCNKLRGIK